MAKASVRTADQGKTLTAVLAASRLPGEEPLDEAELAAIAEFLLACAAQRDSDESCVTVESVSGPIGERKLRIAAINPDMPFLVDSLAATLSGHGLAIARLLHPVVRVRRDSEGRLLALGEGEPESLVYLETGRADARTRSSLRKALQATLGDVHAAVADWPAMQVALRADAERVRDDETAALLEWFAGGKMTQLGHVLRRKDGSQSGALGICRKSARALLQPESYARAFAWFRRNRQAQVLAIKSNLSARVHRVAPLDLILIPHREKGQVTALSVHAGLWTSSALADAPAEIPVLRARLASLMQRLGFDPAGHDGKALVHALTRLPHDLLVSFPAEDLERLATTMMSMVDRPRPRILLVRSPLERHLFAFAWLPRDAMSTAIRLQVRAMLEQAARAEVLDWSLEIEGSTLAMLRFVLDIRDGDPAPDAAPLEARLALMVRGWTEAVEAELAASEEPGRAAAMAARHAEAFPLAYRSAYGAAEAARDIARLRHLAERPAGRDVRLHRQDGDDEGVLRLKLYEGSGTLALSDAVPALENFGFRVLEDAVTDLAGEGTAAIHDFALALPAGVQAGDLMERAAIVEPAIRAVLSGEAEDDAFNRLVTLTGLAPVEAMWLRAWYRYLRQVWSTWSLATAVDALTGAPEVARGLVALFRARHDPADPAGRAAAEAAAEEAIRQGLAGVAAINEDRLLRAMRVIVLAVLRTNAFVPAAAEALAFKLDSAAIPGLPRPVPWREIFVYSQRVEGIHLRSGPVSRGGIRWSDRRDDFRTEVLGLMKAQRVKNAVIVPAGAKGGFYPKQLPDLRIDRDGWLAEGRESYKLFIRSLLSLTDNLVAGKVVHPAGMVIRDGDDPYFVVAADKGTATYSDTANALAEEAQFWLDDAFASGGSKGYDHKAMGITARGGWLSVRRHFLELGTDIQTEPVRVAGVGDMSGDVFGNGMLLSKAMKLVAAFDHRHVFLDPDPDPAKSWAERARLFALPRSSWDDYDRTLISAGGGVFPRSQKSIPLSAQVQAVLGLEVDSIDPEGLISAILKAPVDLLWFGGIGTYIKAGHETNGLVGDPANDAVRVDGADVRARVIGEGANLGCTQAGRIEFALAGAGGTGGRNNTDFIDNSAGVDCSDKEVNIKIALASAKRDGRLKEAARVKLLAAMTDEVAALVLEDNRLQALALSIAEAGGAEAVPSLIRLAETLEAAGQLDRATEGLAGNEALLRRASEGRGLVRPELAVLLSCAKLELQEAIEASPLPDDPALQDELIAAFPQPMRKRFRADILGHRLRREIVATRIANRMVNRLGPVLPFELAEEEGTSLAQVAAAFVTAEALFELGRTWQAIETAAMAEPARIALFTSTAAALRGHMAELLRTGHGALAPRKAISRLGGRIAELRRAARGLLSAEAKAQSARLDEELATAGAPVEVVALVAMLFDLDGAVGLAALAGDIGADASALTRAFGDIGSRLGLGWAQASAARMSPSDPWERLLAASLARDFQQVRLDFLRRETGRKGDPEAAVSGWAERNATPIRQFADLVARARASVPVTTAMLARIAAQARSLLQR